jgi:uncharacterized protein (DUF1697 family)
LTTYLAFLRAINVPGHGIVKMEDLKRCFASAGCKNARTYIQSGNVVFECSDEECGAVLKNIYVKMRKLLGSEPSILFRTLLEVESIVRASPFKKFESEHLTKFYVVFLSEKPRSKPRLPLISEKEALEAIAVKNFEAFVVSRRKPNGFFGFPNNFVEKELGVSATSRNWSTVTKIVEFAKKA